MKTLVFFICVIFANFSLATTKEVCEYYKPKGVYFDEFIVLDYFNGPNWNDTCYEQASAYENSSCLRESNNWGLWLSCLDSHSEDEIIPVVKKYHPENVEKVLNFIHQFRDDSQFFNDVFPRYTDELHKILDYKKIFELNNIRKKEITQSELEMIETAVAATNFNPDDITHRSDFSSQMAWGIFCDGPNGELGGKIEYFKFDDKIYALVVYYPGENEYGVILQLTAKKLSSKKDIRNSKFIKVANISDSDIEEVVQK